MPLNFFALIKNGNNTHVNRVALGNDLQAELSDLFIEQQQAFVNDDIEVIAFDGQYKPEHDEILAIGGFELPQIFKEAIDSPMTLDPLHFNEETNGKIIAIFSGFKEGESYKIMAQLFEGTRLIKPNLMNIVFGSNNEFQKLEYYGMTLDYKLTAYYADSQLHFKSYHFTKRIFDLASHYREATNQEVIAMANHDHFAPVEQESFIAMADHVVRQTIARIQRNNVLGEFTVTQLNEKAGEVNLDLCVNENQKIILPDSKRELKLVLSFFDDQLYLGPISGQTKVSNSSKVVTAA